MHLVLIYLERLRHNLLLKCVSQPKIVKKSIKPTILVFQVIQGHRCQLKAIVRLPISD